MLRRDGVVGAYVFMIDFKGVKRLLKSSPCEMLREAEHLHFLAGFHWGILIPPTHYLFTTPQWNPL